MKLYKLFIRFGLILIAMCFSPLCIADYYVNEHAAEDAKYDCPLPKDTKTIQALARQLHIDGHDKNKLGCAADLMFEAARRSPHDIDIQNEAILFHNDYLSHVNVLNDYDLLDIQGLEWTARAEKASQQVNEIIERAIKLKPDDTTLLTLAAIAKVETTRLVLGPKEAVDAVKKAMKMLEQAITIAPDAVNGLAMITLGRHYYELRGYNGGDNLKAIELYEKAYQSHPYNIRLQRYLVEAYDKEMNTSRATEILQKMLSLKDPPPEERQMFSDELRAGRGIAERLGATKLKEAFQRRREALLARHPELLNRFIEAHTGHFGEHPLTGEKDY